MGADSVTAATGIKQYNNYTKSGVVETQRDGVNIFKRELYSMFIKPGVEVFVSSVYHSPPALIGRLFLDKHHPELARVEANMIQSIQDFIEGRIGAAEIKEVIERTYNDILAYNIAMGRTDGTDPHYNARILFHVQAEFSRRALSETRIANYLEGEAFAQANGLNPGDRWVHYNARFFFANRELQEITTAAISNIVQNEGFDFFNIQGARPHCFNFSWSNHARAVGISTMKDANIEPPKDFVMFFAPRLFSQEAWDNGTTQIITANDPTRTDGHGGWDFHLKVPRGATLFRNLPFWLTQGRHTNMDGESFIAWDITKHLNFKAGADMKSRLKEFFAQFVNDFNKGMLVVWSGGTKNVHDVPFDIFFDDRRMFHGSELTAAVAQNSFISNFEFHMFSNFN